MFIQAIRGRNRGVQGAEQFVPASGAGKRSRHASELAGSFPRAASFQRILEQHPGPDLVDSPHGSVAQGKSQHSDGTDTTRPLETISHYRVIEKLGEGGIGVVYKAEDTRLGRPVALKFLAPHLLNDAEAIELLKSEARLAASLSHPNICSIHDIDRAAGQWFIVTEYLEGETLAQLLLRKTPSFRDVQEYAIQASEALAAAHRHGIVHGDIKPSNLFVTIERQIKLLDFGLAKMVAPRVRKKKDTDRLERECSVSGTFRYMSPEQARGLKTDCRSDIFSFGVVCYELVTGHRPFDGDKATEILRAVITKQPASIDLLCPEVPGGFRRVVQKCLRKDPEMRYQRMDDVLVDLKLLKSSSESQEDFAGRKRISAAVLPFLNLSKKPDDDCFCEAITEDIATDLSKLKGLKVSSPWFEGGRRANAPDVCRIGRELGVDSVLQGSLQRVGKRIRITARLINVADGFHLWAETFDRNADDVLAIQDEIAAAIVRALQVRLTIGETQPAHGGNMRKPETLYRTMHEAIADGVPA